jgi:hypothetical protein
MKTSQGKEIAPINSRRYREISVAIFHILTPYENNAQY